MVHPGGFGTEEEIRKMWQDVAASPYLERIATTPGGPVLYRLH
jgi:predicted Rossmann-fold nucleotide-binding protein